jgi:hypothetical protein
MANDEFDPQQTKTLMVAAFVIAGLAIAIIYAPYWRV